MFIYILESSHLIRLLYQVAMPYLKSRFLPGWLAKGKCIPVEMLKAGWAITYEQYAAEYGEWSKEEFLRIQEAARSVLVEILSGTLADEASHQESEERVLAIWWSRRDTGGIQASIC